MDTVAEDDHVVASPAPGSAIASGRCETMTPSRTCPSTPVSSAIKPSDVEMHPNKHRVSMAEPSSALRLGFSDIKPKTGSRAQGSTPSRTGGLPQANFTFKFGEETPDISLNIGENAQRLLNDLRESVARCKAEMVAKREAEQDTGERKIAQAKGKSGRFSAVHMAEFKKMDSIEGHASAWRAGRMAPAKPEIERSASKASLNTSLTPVKGGLKRSRSKANLDATPQSHVKPDLKTTPSEVKQDGNGETSRKKINLAALYTRPLSSQFHPEPSSSFAKRIKKYQNQDASTARPLFRNHSSSERPATSDQYPLALSEPRMAPCLIPTKHSTGHGLDRNKATITLVESADHEDTTSSVASPPSKASVIGRRILSPRGFQKVKSILRGDRTDNESLRTAIPKPTSKTPGPQPADKCLPPLPLTTPRRRLAKQVSFTPDTKRAAAAQDTPSPKKTLSFKSRLAVAGASVQYPSMDGVLTESQSELASGEVAYPDLSSFGVLDELDSDKKSPSQSAPGRFTFRSDHTIDFDGAPTSGFGASAGQASLRQVRSSTALKSGMPGSFPVAPPPSTHSNKENNAPLALQKIAGAPHGMSNKKRHRVTWDEENAENEAADRAAKKRKNEHVPEGHALVAPRMVAQTPVGSAKRLQKMRGASRTPGSPASPSPTKKRAGISLSRLNALARPKNRA